MEKYKTIAEDIETVTNKKVVRKGGVSGIGVGLIIAGIVCVAAGSHSLWPTFLYSAAAILFIAGIIKLLMGRSNYIYCPTNSRLKKLELYFDDKEKYPLQACLESKEFEKLKQMKRQVNTGIKVEAMVARDSSFIAVQISEFVPYTYETITPVICYYDEDAKAFGRFFTSK